MEAATMIFDLCLAWNWEYDADLAAFLEAACRERGLSLLQVTPDNLAEVWQSLLSGELVVGALFDRASDDQAPFLSLVDWARAHGVRRINPRERALRAWDKATMHAKFARAGLLTPHTIILPPFSAQPELAALDLSSLGASFVIKPACRGGGLGVVHAASSLTEVLVARQFYPNDHYLLQTRVTPVTLGGRGAWFRVIACGGELYPCWWDCQTHVYTPITVEEIGQLGLQPLMDTVHRIATLCGLDLFSTEIALTTDDSFVAVDYVNDPIDLRLQSKTPEGVPDAIVRNIARRLVAMLDCR
jgi:hypothetical protein